MQNYKKPGDVLTVVAPYALDSGEGAKVGAIFGVACSDALISTDVELKTEGVFELVKVGSQAWSKGDKIYWDDGNVRCTSDSAAGMLIGVATEDVASGAGDVLGDVKLCGVTDQLEGAQAAVVVLTDSTGVSGSHDDTIADGLTASSPSAITNYTAVVNMSEPVAKAEGEAVSAALATLQDEVTLLRATVDACVTDLGVQNQNDSDLAQKIIELRARLVSAGIIDA